jgi:hypothetical protein
LRWWQAWRAFSWQQRGRFLQVWFLLPVCMAALRLYGFHRLYARLAAAAPPPADMSPTPETLAAAHQLGRLTNLAARRHLFPATCLHRSFLLWWLLRRQALQPRLQIGVRRAAGLAAAGIEAHAWVELDGQILNDAPDIRTRYAPFPLQDLPPHAHMSR